MLGKLFLWQIPLCLVGIMLVVSLPSLVLAYMKLRKRNLGPILDANGWAVNAKAKINVPFGTSLTGIAKLPNGASVELSDKYAPKSSFLPKFVFLIIALACVWSFLNDDEGRLWRWTKDSDSLAAIHKIAKVPAAIQKALDEQAAKDGAKKTPTTPTVPDATKTAADATAAAVPAAK